MSVNPIQPEDNAIECQRSRSEAKNETADQRALVEQLETVLEFLDQPGVAAPAPKAHHPSARRRQNAKSTQIKVQAALSQLIAEQQQRQQIEQELAVAQETIRQLVELVSRRDKQLVSARHAWDLLKSRSRQAAEEWADRVMQLESTIEHLKSTQVELESQLGEARNDTVCRQDEQTATAEKFVHTVEFASVLEQQLASAREEMSRIAARRDELQHDLERATWEQRSTVDSSLEREVALVQQLEEVQILLSREQEARRQLEQESLAAVRQRDEAYQQWQLMRREQLARDAKHQLEKAQWTDGVQALKAELHQLHVERLATNGFIERMIQEKDSDRDVALKRQRELSQASAEATMLAESRGARIAELQAEMERLQREVEATAERHATEQREQQQKMIGLQAECDRLCQEHSSSDAAKEVEITKLRSAVQRATIMLESQRRELEDAEGRIADEQARFQKTTELYAQQEASISKLESKIESLQSALQREAAARRKAESRLKSAGEQTGEPSRVEDAELKIDQLTEELAAYKKLSKALRQKGSQKLKLAREEIARLRAQIESSSPRQV